ncbi:MAG TPA: aminotransferase class V-fold PLP-dependent enzyme, partial [Myxococcota bacterium]|nr:aminotransferase class V-fold PLP-dependent enzyme [Myxococcota bacterium]
MRPFNFSPGPSIVPPEVIDGAISALKGVPEMQGLSIVEVSHRLPWFEGIVAQTEQALRDLLGIPDSYAVLFLQGGARQQFAQVPMSWLGPGKVAAYVDTGVWARGAYDDAVTLGDARIVASGEANGYTALPDLDAVTWPDNLAYVHTTSNNTIYGTQWGVPGQGSRWPDFDGLPHICDMSS